MDVHYAFLHGDLSKKVYIPLGFQGAQSGKVCRLRKSLYGKKQAPQCWFVKLVHSLRQYGFIQSYFDYSLFTYTKSIVHLNILVYLMIGLFLGVISLL